MHKNPAALAILLTISAGSTALAQPLQNPDPNYRGSISPVVPQAGGSSEGPLVPSNDPNARRVPQLATPTGPGSSERGPSGQDQGIRQGFTNEVPLRAPSNEGNPR